jgi:hypothetical protein
VFEPSRHGVALLQDGRDNSPFPVGALPRQRDQNNYSTVPQPRGGSVEFVVQASRLQRLQAGSLHHNKRQLESPQPSIIKAPAILAP